MTHSENRTLKLFLWGCSALGALSLTIGFGLEIATASALGSMMLVLPVLVGFLWFAQACADSLRENGLGEGTAQLYDEAYAKRLFGENYKRPSDD